MALKRPTFRGGARRDRPNCHAWSERMEGFGWPALPSRIIAQCINDGYGGLEVKCRRSDTLGPACDTPKTGHADLRARSFILLPVVAGWNQFAGSRFDIRWEQTTFEDYHG